MFYELNELINDLVSNNDIKLSSYKKSEIACDILEDNNSYKLYALLPGVKKENIDLSYIDNTLEIKVKDNMKEDEEKYILKERLNSFKEKKIYLKGIDFNKTKASLKDGILTVILPKEEVTKIIID